MARTEDELRQKEEELNKLREKVQRDEANRKEIEEQQTQLMEEKNQLFIQLQRVSMHTTRSRSCVCIVFLWTQYTFANYLMLLLYVCMSRFCTNNL